MEEIKQQVMDVGVEQDIEELFFNVVMKHKI
jgi:hypothetical protein